MDHAPGGCPLSEPLLLDELSVGVLVQARDASIVRWNAAALELLGVTADELTGRTSFDPRWQCIKEDGSPFPGAEHPVPLALRTGQPVRDVVMGVHRPRRNDRVWLMVTAQPRLDARGQPVAAVCTFSDITARKDAEAAELRARHALEQSEATFRTSFRYAGIGKALVGLDGRFLMVNDSLCRTVGYDRHELLALDFQDITHPDDLDADLAQVAALLEGRIETYELAKRYLHKEGRAVWILLTVSLVRDARGEPVHFIAQVQDIDARKRAENALQRSEAQFRSFIERSPVGLVVHEGARVVYANPAYAALLGFDGPSAAVGTSIDDVLHPDEQARAARRRAAYDEADSSFTPSTLWRLIRKDGVEITVDAHAETVEFEGRRARLSMVRDVTERERLLEKLARSEADFRGLIERSPEAIFIHRDGALALANHAYKQLFKLEGTLAGRKIGETVGPSSKVLVGDLCKAKSAGWIECELERVDGSRIVVELCGVWIDFEGSGARLVLLHDVTERSQMARAREEAERALKASLEEKETLLHEVHHRVKNNLQVVSSLLSLKAQQLADPAMRQPFEESRARVRSIALLHERLYGEGNLASIEVGGYLGALIDDLRRAQAPAAQAAVSIEVDAEDLRMQPGVAVPCGLIVNELVTNCYKHAFPDGRRGRVRVAVARRGDRVELSVQDDGVGLPSSDPQRPQSLGLKLVRSLARQLCATVSLQAEPGGARVAVEFPLKV